MSKTTDLQAIRDTLKKSGLSADVRATAFNHLDRLPDLYQQLEKTCENRYLDEILLRVQAMFRVMDSPKTVEAMTLQLHAMHELHGVPVLGIRPPVVVAPKKVRRAKVVSTL